MRIRALGGSPADRRQPATHLRLEASQALFDTVRKAWIDRLNSLNSHGWTVIGQKKTLVYATNYPPFGVTTGDTTAVCHHAGVCPFCYARKRVLNVYRRCAKLLFGDDPPLDKSTVKLAWVRRYKDDAFAGSVGASFGPATAADYMARFTAFSRKHRRDVVRLSRAKRGSVLFTPFPGKSGGLSHRWSGVLFLESKADIDNLKGGPYEFDVVMLDPLKKNLGERVNKAMRYPRPLMYDDPARMALILNGTKNVRHLSHYGPRS